MREKVINADTIDEAVEGILYELKNTTRKEDTIYFDGWDGLGASPVLRAVAGRLTLKEPGRPRELEFDQIIHVDCSKWKNTRTLQREIAKQLKLPNHVMEMFDKQEEEDDFNGVTDDSSRVWIDRVAAEIGKSTGRRFLLVLHNGSNEEIDISNSGLVLFGVVRYKMIWTFKWSFQMDRKTRDKVKKSNKTHILLSASSYDRDPQDLWSYLLHQNATEAASRHDIEPAIVVDCFLYMSTLHCNSLHHVSTDDLAAHTCNYWICDGIIQRVRGSIDEAWRVGDALQGEMRYDMDYYRHEVPPHLARFAESIPHWTSPTYGFVAVPSRVIPCETFTRFDKLCVLKLSRCAFSFSSPPFACCHVLRFLWLHHCQDLRSTAADKGEDTAGSWACFKSLWVLDLRYTDCDLILSADVMDLMTQLRELNVMGAKNWDMRHIRGRLCNIRKLRVTRSTCCGLEDKDLFSEMKSMELIDFSGNQYMQGLTSLSLPAGSSSLEAVIVDGCDWLKSISLRCCQQVKKVLLIKGHLPSLEELDLSGTGVKTLDLGQVDAPVLTRLILLGCQKLVAIKWPSKGPVPDLVLIDTTSTSGSTPGDPSLQEQKEEIFGKWRISVADARFLWSLCSAIPRLGGDGDLFIHIDVCPAAALGTSAGSDSPKIYRADLLGCYVKLMTQGKGSQLLVLPPGICDVATSLHVYDDSSITRIPKPPQGPSWNQLRLCRIERCPSLQTIFPDVVEIRRVPEVLPLFNLETLEIVYPGDLTEVIPDELQLCYHRNVSVEFPNLKHIHLHELPMLQHISRHWIYAPNLETIKIRGCRSLTRLPFIGKFTKPPMVDCEKEWWNMLQWDEVEAGHHPSLYQL